MRTTEKNYITRKCLLVSRQELSGDQTIMHVSMVKKKSKPKQTRAIVSYMPKIKSHYIFYECSLKKEMEYLGKNIKT